MLEIHELMRLKEEQKQNYLTFLYQKLSSTPFGHDETIIKVMSGKIQALDEFGYMLIQFMQDKINQEV